MEYRNPIYTIDGRIDCEINHPEYGWIPFTADSYDVEEHGRNLFKIISDNGGIKEYVPPDNLCDVVRAQRDYLLSSSDWSQLPDVPEALKNKWAIYRQALRDIPLQEGFPYKVKWPEI